MTTHFKKNWYRVLGTFVVCFCALWTAWDQTHANDPRANTKTEIVQVKEGDGFLNEKQCRSIKIGTGRNDLRGKYGFPASEGNTDQLLFYPIRDHTDRYCNVHLGWHSAMINSGDDRVIKVTLDLRVD